MIALTEKEYLELIGSLLNQGWNVVDHYELLEITKRFGDVEVGASVDFEGVVTYSLTQKEIDTNSFGGINEAIENLTKATITLAVAVEEIKDWVELEKSEQEKQ